MRLSIITIALKDVDGLTQTIESALPLARELGNSIEHLILDSSPLEHAEVRLKFEQQPQIRWQVCPPEGIYAAINRGIQSATGEILWHLHSTDTVFDPAAALVALVKLERSDADLLFSDVRLVREGKFMFVHRHENNFKRNLLGSSSLHHQGVLFKRKVFEEVGLFSVKQQLASDYEFFIRVANARLKTIHFETPFVNYDTGGRSLTHWPRVLGESFRLQWGLKTSVMERLTSLFHWLWHFSRLAVLLPVLKNVGLYDRCRYFFYKIKSD